jgi:DNA-binding GntR family transcriptional regulator
MSQSSDAIDLRSIKTVATIITDRLADDIQNGVLLPGERLVQMDLAQRFQVSRVAVRDALMDLRRRGLSVSIPMRGDIVRPVSTKTVRDLFEIRRINETYAVLLACQRITPGGLSRLHQVIDEQASLLEKEDIGGFLEKDWEFHRTLYDFADNEPLRELIEGLWARTRQARSVARRDTPWAKNWGQASIARHQEILGAVVQKDGRKAAAILETTIVNASQELCRELVTSGWDALDQGDGP